MRRGTTDLLADGDAGPFRVVRGHDRVEQREVAKAVSEVGQGRESAHARNLLQECSRFESKEVVLTESHRWEVHGQASGDVRVVWSDEHLAITVGCGIRSVVREAKFTGAGEVVRGSATGREDFKAE